LRLRKHGLQRETLILLAPGWATEEHQNGGIGQAVADASQPETCFAEREVSDSLRPAGAFRLFFGTIKVEKPLDLASVLNAIEEGPAVVQENWHFGGGLAYFSAHRGNHAGTGGEHQFTIRDYLRPFRGQSRLNGVIYRPKWANTRWTAVEEQAIKESCLDNSLRNIFGCVVENTGVSPKWLPDTHVYFNCAQR
jgi:hypothetical protein